MFEEEEEAFTSRGPGRPRKLKPHKVDEVATQEAVVAFYRKRLAEAEERLHQIVASGGKRPQ